MKLSERIDQFFFGTFDTRVLGVFRIATGLLLLVHTISSRFYWEQAYGPSGMAADASGNYYAYNWFSVFDQTQNTVSMETWWWVLLILNILWLIGLGGRLTSFLLWVLVTSVYVRNYLYSNGEQSVWRFALFHSFLLPVTEHFSVDAWIRKKMSWPEPPPCRRWVLRSLQLYLCSLYYVSSPWKWFSEEAWRVGDAMYYVAINETWGRVPFVTLFYNGVISKFTTWASLIIEWTFSIMVFIPRFRKWVTVDLIFFQILIAIFLNNVTYFSLSTATCLIVFFEWQDLVELASLKLEWRLPTWREFLDSRREDLHTLQTSVDRGLEVGAPVISLVLNLGALLSTGVLLFAIIKKVNLWESATAWGSFSEFAIWISAIALLWWLSVQLLPSFQPIARALAAILVMIALLRYGHLVAMGFIKPQAQPPNSYAHFSAIVPMALWILVALSDYKARFFSDEKSKHLVRWMAAISLLIASCTTILLAI